MTFLFFDFVTYKPPNDRAEYNEARNLYGETFYEPQYN